MTTRISVLILSLVLTSVFLFNSCKDNTTGSVGGSNYYLRIIVMDAQGNPVDGLRVSAWGLLSTDFVLNKSGSVRHANEMTNVQAQTTLSFSLAANANVVLTVFNLLDRPIDTLINRVMAAGQYQFNWSTAPGLTSGVYKIQLHASNDTVHFQDSIYAVCHTTDPEQNVIGWTNSNGMFDVYNAYLFPRNLHPPTLNLTYANGPEIIGTFSYTDSVMVVLTDTSLQRQRWYIVKIGDRQNTDTLIWSPLKIEKNFVQNQRNSLENPADSKADSIVIIPPGANGWILRQNYPNPFN
jgi:hypothetical protein